MKTCEKCIFWDQLYIYSECNNYMNNSYCWHTISKRNLTPKIKTSKGFKPTDFGYCDNDHFIYDDAIYDDQIQGRIDSLFYMDGETCSAYFTVGKLFGCLYFKEKEEKRNDNI